MRERIYLAIIERLKAHKVGIKHFSLWNNNLTYLTKAKGFNPPALFIEFEPIYWKQLQNRSREAPLRVRLHIITKCLGTPEDGSKYQKKALEHLSLIDRVNKALTGFSGDYFNSFMLVESITDHDHEEILHNEEIFTTHVRDVSSQISDLKPVQVRPVLSRAEE